MRGGSASFVLCVGRHRSNWRSVPQPTLPRSLLPRGCLCACAAGHGGSVADTSGDEADNKDETMVPVDYKSSGQITDDEILKEVRSLLRSVGRGPFVVAVFGRFPSVVSCRRVLSPFVRCVGSRLIGWWLRSSLRDGAMAGINELLVESLGWCRDMHMHTRREDRASVSLVLPALVLAAHLVHQHTGSSSSPCSLSVSSRQGSGPSSTVVTAPSGRWTQLCVPAALNGLDVSSARAFCWRCRYCT